MTGFPVNKQHGILKAAALADHSALEEEGGFKRVNFYQHSGCVRRPCSLATFVCDGVSSSACLIEFLVKV